MESNNNTYVPLFSKKDCKYTSCYCEENTFLLCKKFVESLPNEVKLNDQIYLSQGYCVFATNSEKQTEIRFQKAGNQDLYKTVTW